MRAARSEGTLSRAIAVILGGVFACLASRPRGDGDIRRTSVAHLGHSDGLAAVDASVRGK